MIDVRFSSLTTWPRPSTPEQFDAQVLLLRVSGWDKDSGAPAEITPKAVYRAALKVAHPDRGGNASLFTEVQEAGRKLGVA